MMDHEGGGWHGGPRGRRVAWWTMREEGGMVDHEGGGWHGGP